MFCVVQSVGVTDDCAEDSEEKIGADDEAHTTGYLTRGAELASPRSAEEPHDNWSEQDNEGGIEELPYLRCHAIGIDKVAGKQR